MDHYWLFSLWECFQLSSNKRFYYKSSNVRIQVTRELIFIFNPKGALAGLISGLAFSLWVGFGGPKPPIPRLSQRNDGCSALLNATSDSLTDLYLSTVSTSPIPTLPSTTDDYFPLYRISYMWYAPLGFLMTILVAQVVSRIVNAYLLSRGTSNKKINEELFSPMFPKCFRTAHHLPDPILLVHQ